MENINIAIDGPVSSGKSTISKLLAQKTGKHFISTGLIYRAISYFCIQNKINIKNVNEILQIIDSMNIEFDDESNIVVNGKKLIAKIRTEEISILTPQIASIPKVREKLILLQRTFALKGNTIMEGRDIGTIILPNADLKIFLICNLFIRAKRRYNENIKLGINCSLEEIKTSIKQRDYLDTTREISPLKKAKDAIVVDSSYLTVDEVVKKIIKHIK